MKFIYHCKDMAYFCGVQTILEKITESLLNDDSKNIMLSSWQLLNPEI